MKRNRKKIWSCLVMILLFASVLSACGNNSAGSGSSQDESSADAPMTKEEYVAEVNSICDEILTVSSKYEDDMNSGDVAQALEATKSMVGEIRPLYVDLGELKAPAEFEEQQSKIKDGCDASVEVLDLSVQLMEMEDADQSQEDIQSISERITELSPKLSDLNTVLSEVRAA